MKRLHDQQNTVQSLQVATSPCNHKSLNGCHVKISYQKWLSALNARISLKSDHTSPFRYTSS